MEEGEPKAAMPSTEHQRRNVLSSNMASIVASMSQNGFTTLAGQKPTKAVAAGPWM